MNLKKNMLNPKSKSVSKLEEPSSKFKLSLEEPPNKLWNVETRSFLKGRTHNMSYLSVKQGSLFCFVLFVLMRFTELGCFKSHSWSRWKALKEKGRLQITFLVSLESSKGEGEHGLGLHVHLDLWCKSS